MDKKKKKKKKKQKKKKKTKKKKKKKNNNIGTNTKITRSRRFGGDLKLEQKKPKVRPHTYKTVTTVVGLQVSEADCGRRSQFEVRLITVQLERETNISTIIRFTTIHAVGCIQCIL